MDLCCVCKSPGKKTQMLQHQDCVFFHLSCFEEYQLQNTKCFVCLNELTEQSLIYPIEIQDQASKRVQKITTPVQKDPFKILNPVRHQMPIPNKFSEEDQAKDINSPTQIEKNSPGKKLRTIPPPPPSTKLPNRIKPQAQLEEFKENQSFPQEAPVLLKEIDDQTPNLEVPIGPKLAYHNSEPEPQTGFQPPPPMLKLMPPTESYIQKKSNTAPPRIQPYDDLHALAHDQQILQQLNWGQFAEFCELWEARQSNVSLDCGHQFWSVCLFPLARINIFRDIPIRCAACRQKSELNSQIGYMICYKAFDQDIKKLRPHIFQDMGKCMLCRYNETQYESPYCQETGFCKKWKQFLMTYGLQDSFCCRY